MNKNAVNQATVNQFTFDPLSDSPTNANDNFTRLTPSPKKSQIRFFPREGQERKLPKIAFLKAMDKKGSEMRAKKRLDSSAEKRQLAIARN